MSSSTLSKAERTAAQAWDYLSSAMAETASKAASVAGDKSQEWADRSQEFAGKAAGKAGGKADVAWARANAAAAALAGRKPSTPWGLLIVAGLAGAAVGWAAATYTRTALAKQAEAEERELTETAVIVGGTDV
ncbi:hypothetical protein GCM10010172_18440 [Paractinoplanes ferrugineus]|uniref:Uncharacterized protein n=1 Tax=Paractinoplanes ferrugineus TaxID=113564 RepID=A0A919MJL6_9ACTN|nr:hypothetical protein [Actinoplanes ferrugineus]GIE14865.1 hypothetical protein Afe05nite_67050 [Actinoplanes ferrugineus]